MIYVYFKDLEQLRTAIENGVLHFLNHAAGMGAALLMFFL
jgi:hypothetical protein